MKAWIISSALSLAICAAGCSQQPAASQNQSQSVAQGGPPSSSPSAVAQGSPSPGANANVKVYRGSLNDRGLEMRLVREGQRVSGFYDYDGIDQDIGLEGRAGEKGKFELAEREASGKQTGKWSCGPETEGQWGEDFTCKWTKPDGRGEIFVALYGQASFAPGLRVAPKVVENRKVGVRASYPQIVAEGGAQLSVAAAHFNRLLEEKAGKPARDFGKELDPSPNLYLHTDYNVLAATDDLVSVEVSFDSFEGGAHPNFSYDAVTYDLRADREIKLEELFKPGSAYVKTIGAYCAADIKKRESESAGEGAKQGAPDSQDESLVSREELEQISAFAVTPKGLMIYYELPHVIAALDRNFVPYSAIKDKLKPDSPVARLAQ